MQREIKPAEGRGSQSVASIPALRERMQTRGLVVVVGALLVIGSVDLLRLGLRSTQGISSFSLAFGFSLTFGILVWSLRAATPAAALWGSLICLVLTFSTEATDGFLLGSELVPLMALFLLTFLATRLGQARQRRLGLAEAAHGRNAAQVIANLGAAGLVAALSAFALVHHVALQLGSVPGSVLMLSALTEATADTVSSEIGQTFGGTPWLITRLRPVPQGTDGGISVAGTSAGISGAAIIAVAGAMALRLNWHCGLIAFAAGVAGLFFDSLLGATLERRGWLGNDLVNFSSTVFAVLCAALLLAVI